MAFMKITESESAGNKFNLSQSEDDTSDLSSDDVYSESSESEDDNMSLIRMLGRKKKCALLRLVLILQKTLE